MATEKDKKQVMDVAKPGSTGASPTARPIIVSHGGIMKDPMVTESSASTEEAKAPAEPEIAAPAPTEEKSLTAPSHKVIQPISTQSSEPAEKEESKPAEEEQSDNDETPLEGSEEAVVDAVVDQAANKKKEGEPTEEEKKQQEAIEKLIEDETYFVPIGQVARRHRRYAFIAVLIVLLLVGGGIAYALQSGLVKLDKIIPGQVPQQTSTTQPTPQSTPAPVKQETPKLTTFNDATLGIKFSYPAEWGATTVTDNSKETTEKGKRALVTFSKQPKVTIGLKAAAWKDGSKDVSRACGQPGFTAYESVKTDLDNGTRVVAEKADRQVVERLEGGLCGDLLLFGDVKFAKSTQYAGVEIQYIDKATDKFDLAQRIADYKKNYDKYFAPSLRQQVVDFTNSVAEL